MRFTDILTTASAIANYLGQPDVEATHLLAATEILAGHKTMDDMGRPVSPLLRRFHAPQPGSTPGVRSLAQRWFEQLGGQIAVELEGEALERFLSEVRELAAQEGYSELFKDA